MDKKPVDWMAEAQAFIDACWGKPVVPLLAKKFEEISNAAKRETEETEPDPPQSH